MPLLDRQSLIDMLATTRHCECGAIVRRNYCRACDEFYWDCHRAHCNSADASDALVHEDHRNYRHVIEGGLAALKPFELPPGLKVATAGVTG
jgi:hypothetical protein